MVFAVDLAQAAFGDVGVDLGGGDGGMAEEFLDDAEVGPMFEEVGGEAVSEHVGGDGPADSGEPGAFADSEPEGDGGEGRAAPGQEDGARAAGGEEGGSRDLEIALEGGDGDAADGDDSFLAAFADDGCVSGLEVELFEAEGAKFSQAQARGVGEFENGLVAEGVRGFGLDRGEQAADFRIGERFGQSFPASGEREMCRGVVWKKPFPFAVAIEGSEGGDSEVEGCGAEGFGRGWWIGLGTWRATAAGVGLGLVLEEGGEVWEGDLGPLGEVGLGGSPGYEPVEHGFVGAGGVVGLTPLMAQVGEEVIDQFTHAGVIVPGSAGGRQSKTGGIGKGPGSGCRGVSVPREGGIEVTSWHCASRWFVA